VHNSTSPPRWSTCPGPASTSAATRPGSTDPRSNPEALRHPLRRAPGGHLRKPSPDMSRRQDRRSCRARKARTVPPLASTRATRSSPADGTKALQRTWYPIRCGARPSPSINTSSPK